MVRHSYGYLSLRGGRGKEESSKVVQMGSCVFIAVCDTSSLSPSSYTSDEASLATDLLLLCHGGHLPPPSGHRHREQNLPGFFRSIQ